MLRVASAVWERNSVRYGRNLKGDGEGKGDCGWGTGPVMDTI